MKPAWDELAGHVEGTSVGVFDVDCTKERDLCSENGVRGYPTIKYSVSGGEFQKYSGGRDIKALKSFVAETFPAES